MCSIRLVLCTATKLIAKSLLVSTEPPQCNVCFLRGCVQSLLCSKRRTSTSLSCVLHLQLLLEKWSCCWSCKSTVLTGCPRFCCHGHKSAVCVTALSCHTIFIALGALTDDLCCGIQCLEVCLLFAPLPQLYPTWVIKRITSFFKSHLFYTLRPPVLQCLVLWQHLCYNCCLSLWRSSVTQQQSITDVQKRSKSVLADLCYRSPRAS